ncbi:DUF5005 domain-containing protein [Bacteroides sp.]|uniref:DUF5005 domain-containing protein n=1 Tax=Bacteroides sp. TaxID=29523 RepID=UPI002629DF50|nr:DUF5005 domain-containing protein [Bacteroides sp.]MDD3036616.1 DUF5005 domain-containing protein [Bacteroides sp.]
MRRKTLYSALYTAFVAVALAACNDYDAVQTAYEDKTDDDVTITPPTIESSWELQQIPNVGQHNENVFVYKDKKYDKLFTRTLGWNGGSGAQTTLLPDGNVFWTFNDSYYGVVDAGTRARGNCNVPHNSVMVQTADAGRKIGETDDNLKWLADYVQTTNPDGEGYYHAYAHITSEENTTDDKYFYQAADATVFDDNGTKKLQMLWKAIDNREGKMTRTGTCLVTYSLEGQPGADTYLEKMARDENFNTDAVGYGSTMWEDEDGHTYLYVTDNNRPIVARTTTHDLTSEWEYYIRDLSGNFVWQKTYPTSEERIRSSIMENNYVCNMPWVFKKGDKYYMVAQTTSYGRIVYIYCGETPYGPFTGQKILFNVPYTVDKIGNQYYKNLSMINLHPELSRQGELVFSTNTDADASGDNFNFPGSADFYRPYFYRVFNWESLYDEKE